MMFETDDDRLGAAPALLGMAAALALLYWGDALPLAPLPQILALIVFTELALLRPDLALLTVPATAPLYLIPAEIPGLRAEPLRFPLHELALLATAAALAGGWLWRLARAARPRTKNQEPRTGDVDPGAGSDDSPRPAASGLRSLQRYLPHALFLLAGLIGALIAVPEGRGAALRELRWLILEPLLFYALLRRQIAAAPELRRWAAVALVGSGAVVALIGLLQLAGLDITPLIGEKQNFGSASVVEVDGLRRVTSVFGHPNNLGLSLGRAWPLAAALALWAGARDEGRGTRGGGRHTIAFGLAALVMLAGLAASLSRGAWLGALAAAAVLFLMRTTNQAPGAAGAAVAPRFWARSSWFWAIAVVLLAVVAAVALTLRGGLGGGSVDARLLLWREALELIRQHPLGLGLDGFYYYHNPEFGRSLIDPTLLGTSEQFASHPHNLVLDAWLNVGPLGLAALAWLVIHWYRIGIRSLRLDPGPSGAPRAIALGALAALTASLVHGSVDVFYFAEDLALVFWLLLAISEGPPDRA